MTGTRLKSTLELGAGVGGGLSLLTGLVTDFLIPVAPYGFYIATAALLFLLLSLVLFFIPISNRFLGTKLAHYWYLPVFLLLLVATSSTYALYFLSKNSGSTGFLAANVDEISRLQQSLGLIQTSLSNIEQSTASMDRKMDNLKKETSEDPRKELSNMGLSWQYDNFIDALTNQDLRAVELYLQGGMKLRDSDFTHYVEDLYANNTSALLSKYDAIETDAGCPASEYRMDFYGHVVRQPEKVAFVREVCATPRLATYLDEQISQEKQRLEKARAHNADLTQARQACYDELGATPPEQYLDEIIAFDPKTLVIKPPKGTVVSKLYYQMVLVGSGMIRDKEYFARQVKREIKEACDDWQKTASVKTSKLEVLTGIKTMLFGA